MHYIALQFAEDEVQHVVKMHTDIGGYAEGFTRVALPAFHVPLAAAGDVGQLDVVLVILLASFDQLFQIYDRLVVAQLQDVVQTTTSFLFSEEQVIEHRSAGHQRFFTDHVTTKTKASSDVRMMQVVGRTDRNDIERGHWIALQSPGVVVEAFKLSEEFALRRKAVDNTYRIIDIEGTGKLVTGVLDGTHVARGDIAGSANKGKSFHAVSRKRLERTVNALDEACAQRAVRAKNTQALMTFACGTRYLPRLSTNRRACC